MPKKVVFGRSVRQNVSGYLLILPAFVIILVFSVYPILNGIFLSFTQWDGISRPVFVGLQNYVDLFSDKQFGVSLLNTLLYVAGSVPATLVLSVLFAALLNLKIRCKRIFRVIYYLPAITSGVAIAMVWRWLYNTNSGLVNTFLYAFGIQPVDWLGNSRYALLSVIIMGVWKSLGSNIIIVLAGLQGVNASLYEAAEMDTNSAFKKFLHITVPMISPTLFLVCIMSVISAFQVFEQVMTLTKGGPGNATLTVVYDIYNEAFANFKMGYASTLAYVLFFLILIVTIVQWVVKKHWVYSEME